MHRHSNAIANLIVRLRWSSICISFIVTADYAEAADRFWIAGASGNFSQASNWNPAIVPGPADRARFANPGVHTVLFCPAGVCTNQNTRQMLVEGGEVNLLLGTAVWDLNAASPLIGVEINNAKMTLFGAGSGGHIDSASILIHAPTAMDPIGGVVHIQSAPGTAWKNDNHLAILGGVMSASSLEIYSGTVLTGTCSVSLPALADGSSKLIIDGPNAQMNVTGLLDVFNNEEFGLVEVIVANGGELNTNQMNLTASGLVGPNQTKAHMSVSDPGSSWSNTGNVLVGGAPGARLFISDGAAVDVAGTMHITSAADFVIDNATLAATLLQIDGSVKGAGTIAGDVLNTFGFVEVDGTISVSGQYTQNTGTLFLEIGSPNPGQYDVLNVSGQASLGGKLRVKDASSFDPKLGHTYDIVPVGSFDPANPRFDVALLPALPDTMFWRVLYQETSSLAGAGDVVQLVVANLESRLGFDPSTFDFTGAATGVATGDLNADGFDDLAVTITTGPTTPGTVAILISDGNGGFAGTVNEFTVGRNPVDVAIGTFDNNVSPDLAVLNQNDGNITLLANNGAGNNFTVLGTISVGLNANALAAGELNGGIGLGADLGIDIAVVRDNPGPGGELRVLINDGAGGFTMPNPAKATGDNPVRVDPADVDNDRDFDLVVLNNGSDSVGVYASSAPGEFDAAVIHEVGKNPVDMAIVSINGDGPPEIITANTGVTDERLSILVNSSGKAGEFAASIDLPLDDVPASLAVSNFNNNGEADIVVLPAGKAVLTVLRNDTDASQTDPTIVLSETVPIPVEAGSFALVTGSLDGKSGEDLLAISDNPSALAGPPTASVSILLNATQSLIPGDIDDNGVVNVLDLLLVIGGWGSCPAPPAECPADVNTDGAVNVLDLLLVIANWG